MEGIRRSDFLEVCRICDAGPDLCGWHETEEGFGVFGEYLRNVALLLLTRMTGACSAAMPGTGLELGPAELDWDTNLVGKTFFWIAGNLCNWCRHRGVMQQFVR